MNLELKDYLEIFSKLPEYLKQASQYAMNHKDRNYDNIVSYRRFSRELSKYVYNFEKQFKGKISQETFIKIRDNIYNAIWLTRNMVDIMEEAYFTKNENELDKLTNIVDDVDRIKQLSEMNIDEIVNEYENKQDVINNSHLFSTEASSNNTITNINTNTTPLSLEQKLDNIEYHQGDNYSRNVVEVTVNHEFENLQRQIDVLTSKPSLTFKEQQTLKQLQLNQQSLTNYINSYKNNLVTNMRENKLFKNEGKIAELQERLEVETEKENLSFLGRRIQKHNINSLNNRIKKLQQKRGQIMSVQMKKTFDKVNRTYEFSTSINDIRAFGQTLGTEIQNIGVDLANRFHSCAKDNTLNNRIQQLKSKKGIMEATYPIKTVQRRYAM